MSPLNVTCVSADINCMVNNLWLSLMWGRRDIYCQMFHKVLNFGVGLTRVTSMLKYEVGI